MNKTFEQCKQEVAEKYGYLTPPYTSETVVNEAAELWQSSNLERIKELEEELSKAQQIIQTLMEYGNLKRVEGVIYGGASHSDYLIQAQLWLSNRRNKTKSILPDTNNTPTKHEGDSGAWDLM